VKITHLRIENYKGLHELDIPLSRFACLIGENNAGKSSVLQAVSLFFSGSTLPKTHYFDADSPIRIEVSFSEIADTDIDRLAEEHRIKIRPIVKNGALNLVRLYGADGKSVLKYRKFLPREERFSDDKIAGLIKGQKAGPAFVDTVIVVFPELRNAATAAMNQSEMKAKIQELADSLPDDQKSPADVDLPTGIDKSISAMLPELIYIPAVKDLKDDVKTSESTPFGKLLGILLKTIEPQFDEEKTLFEKLNKKLNRVIQLDGSEKDERLIPVKTIEQTIERFVQDSFKTVKLHIAIPPPELKTVLSSALIYANDGVDGLIESKGDGLRRAIVFAILRSFVELSKTGLIPDGSAGAPTDPRYLLLFEEPELYLHPKAQQVLFDALGTFSLKHPVVVTTHSPVFFGPQSTTTFIKMQKKTDATVASKPFGAAHPIDLGNTSARDQFQIICYENNNIAFFAETVVLVEGDSDYIVLPHLARVINPVWDSGQLPVRFARIGGKGNMRRYKQFFSRFQTRVVVVTDLDFLLGAEFGQIEPADELKTQRDRLLEAVDAIISPNGVAMEPNTEQIKDAHERGDLRALWKRACELQAKQKAGQASLEDVVKAVDEWFAWGKYWLRRDVLRQCPTPQLLAQKRALLDDLRGHGVCVLEKGTIEDYYPDGIIGEGKPARAQCFCNAVTTRERVLELCSSGHKGMGGVETSEFEAMFQTIFGS
jgi:AAA ATPase domain/Overcoming lysogenization defect protein-like, TOPRIM domain